MERREVHNGLDFIVVYLTASIRQCCTLTGYNRPSPFLPDNFDTHISSPHPARLSYDLDLTLYRILRNLSTVWCREMSDHTLRISFQSNSEAQLP